MADEKKCTLSDQELIEKCRKWVTDLCESTGQKWTLRVLVDFNRDPDILFSELIRRFKTIIEPHEKN